MRFSRMRRCRLRGLHRRAFIAACALWLAFAAAPAAAEGPGAAQVLDAFARIAFGNEYEADHDPRLQKWTEPVRYRIGEIAPLDEAERAFLYRHLHRLERLTGLDVAPAPWREEANFLVLFVPEARYAETIERYIAPARRHLLPRFAGTACLGLLRNHRVTHAIVQAVAIIPIDRARDRGLAMSCIAEETTQILGLLNDSDDVPDTLFNDKSNARDLTPLDEMMVRLLYHPRLLPGMKPAEALGIAREVLPELLRLR